MGEGPSQNNGVPQSLVLVVGLEGLGQLWMDPSFTDFQLGGPGKVRTLI